MTDIDAGGNTVDSPATDGDQATSTTNTSTDAGVGDSTDQGQKAGSQPAVTGEGDIGDKGSTGGDKATTLPDKETLPFDQHPKWKSARAAEMRVNEILETHGYDSIDDLMEAANEHKSLKALIGNRDAEAIVKDFEEFQRVKEFWAQQEAERLKATETPEETIERLEREKRELLNRSRQEQEIQEAAKESQRVVAEFDSLIRETAQSLPDVSDIEKSMLVEFMGADNEMSIVDPYDRVAVKKARDKVVGRFQKYISDIRQKAVDDYVHGKSGITPITKTDSSTGTEHVATERKPLPPGTTVDQANKMAKEDLLARLQQAANAG